jgi:hypothetical protein
MKKTLILLTAALTLALSATAQTTPPPIPTNAPAATQPAPTSESFVGTVESWMTSFSSNTWSGKGFISTGAIYEHKVNVGNYADLAIDVKDLSTNLSLYAEAGSVNALALGATVDADAGIGLGYKIHDVQILLSGKGGYSWLNKGIEGEVDLALQKKMTANTFLEIGLGQTIQKSSNTRGFLGAGFTF